MEMRRINNVAIITLDQRLSGGPSNVELTDLIRQLVSDGVAHVIFDCHNVELINSSGLGSLVAAHTTLHAHGGDARLSLYQRKFERCSALPIWIVSLELPTPSKTHSHRVEQW